MSEHMLLEQVLSEIASLRQEVGKISGKVDRVYDRLYGESVRAENPPPQRFRPPSTPQEPPAATDLAAGLTGNWVERLARQARELGLDIPEEALQQMPNSPPGNDES